VERDTSVFRTCLFGGFNRHDVIEYITSLIKQRDKYIEENKKLVLQIERLQANLESKDTQQL